MKMKMSILLVLCLGRLAFGAGSLTPPGAPAPTMKTLDEIDLSVSNTTAAVKIAEPRIAVSKGGMILSSPGSYYLTTNLVITGSGYGLSITVDNVTVDLNGFSILGASSTGTGIGMNNRKNVVIKNGTIRDAYYHGISALLTSQCQFKNLRIIGNGRSDSFYDGIRSGIDTTITGCFIAKNGSGVEVAGGSKIIDNQIINNTDKGLKLTGTESYITKNIVKGNGENYDFAQGNFLNILLCEIPETIRWPCSIKLAGSLTPSSGNTGISVFSNNVSIDLCGHALIGTGADSGSGIWMDSNAKNLRVCNGSLRNWKGTYQGGISALGENIQIEKVQISDCYYGVSASSKGTISKCSSCNNEAGFSLGSGFVITECSASKNRQDGIYAYSNNVISCCSVGGCGMTGIFAQYHNSIIDCTSTGNDENGIKVDSDSFVSKNMCSINGKNGSGAGVYVLGHDCRIENNSCTDNDWGIKVDGNGNFIVKNTASGNGTNYTINAGSHFRISTTLTGAEAWDNFEF